MLGIFLLSVATVGAISGLYDLLQDDIDTNDIEEDLDLQDEATITELEEAFVNDPTLAQGSDIPEEDLLIPYEDTDWSSNNGTDGDDFIAFPEDLGAGEADPIFGNGGDDVLLGSNTDETYDVLFGDEGDDTIFGRGGFDQIFGGDGDDTLSGGDGGDLIVAGNGSDVVYGGAGDDTIYDGDNITDNDGATSDADSYDVIIAGDGDDGVIIEDGINLVSLGDGSDHLMVHGESGETVGAVVTDFDPNEDALLIGAYSEDIDLPTGTSGIALDYSLTEIETSLGTGTFVQPVVDADDLEHTTGGYAFLLGVSPEQLQDAEIQVILTSDESVTSDASSIQSVAVNMGATRI